MTIDDDTRLDAEFAAYRQRSVPTYIGRGGAAARATVTKRRHRTRAALALLAVVALGVGLTRLDRSDEDRLVPADVRPSPTSPASPTSPTGPAPGPLDNATIDFSALPEEECGGPTVRLKEASAFVDRLDTTFDYYVAPTPTPKRVDLTGDGVPDWVAVLGCVGEGGGAGRDWVLVLTGDLPNLKVAGRGYEVDGVDRVVTVSQETGDGGIETIGIRIEGGGKPVNLHWNGSRLVE